jgi:hypothetical protein
MHELYFGSFGVFMREKKGKKKEEKKQLPNGISKCVLDFIVEIRDLL